MNNTNMDINDPPKWFKFLKTANIEDIATFLKRKANKKFLNLVNSDSQQGCLHFVVTLTKVNRGNKLLELLVSKGANANHLDSLQQTPLFYAAKLGHKHQVRGLLQSGADANFKDLHGQTPLYYASREGHRDSIKALLEGGAEIDSSDNLGQTALFYACREGDLASAKLLLDNGSDVNHKDESAHTPLYWAKRSRNKELVKHLQTRGADELPLRRRRPEKQKQKRTEKKVQCLLMRVDQNGEKTPITEEEFKDFEENFPEIFKFFSNPEQLVELDSINQDTLDSLKPWEKPAKKLFKALWKHEHAWIFHEPVDPVKLKIPDYFEYIKEPMDFGTIKKKLFNNVYKSAEDLIDDFQLVFRNCRTYNPPGSEVIKMCDAVEDLYEVQTKELDLAKYR